jgi:hypothetical protein
LDYIRWTSQEKKILVCLAKKGWRAKEIQKILKSRSLNAIKTQADNLRISLAGPKPEIDLEAYKAIMKVVKA